jgi:alanyl-tRNA synthetase
VCRHGRAYPKLAEREEYIKKVVRAEEERFIETLDNGLPSSTRPWPAEARGRSGHPRRHPLSQLYDTFGFPTDLTADIVRPRGSPSTKPASRSAWNSSGPGPRALEGLR